MVYDSLDNIEFYNGLSNDIFVGLTFLKQVSSNVANGVYQLNSRVKAIVSEYETKSQKEYGFESHRRFSGIQGALNVVGRGAYLTMLRL